MLAKIFYKRIYDKNSKNSFKVKIVDFSGIYRYPELPFWYRKYPPHFWLEKGAIRGKDNIRKVSFHIKKGDVYSIEVFRKIMASMKEAGERLIEIREEMRREKRKWEDNKIRKIVI
ncbi:MAG: hypothetical protein J7K62_01965 [Thermoplasmata archaeon]|nr:hypothetical protein [Thermoplasmata archaeon]